MKTLFNTMLILLLLALAFPVQVFSQDILDIAPTPPGNINNIINGDTLAGGLRAHPNRIYRLERGKVYQVTEPMTINGPITIIATDGTGRPPVLAPAILPDNSSIGDFFRFIGKGSKVDISNIYLLSIRADGNQLGWSTGMSINADSIHLKLRGVIMDGFTATGISLNAHWSKMDVQDCHFRNFQHSSAWFGGQPFLSGAPIHMDTCKFINNTFFACNSYLWSIRGYDKYSVFEHNSVIYGIVNPFLMRAGSHMHINNNLFYSAHSMGGNPDHVINGWFLNYPDTASSSIIRLRGLDSVSYWSKLWGSNINGPNSYLDPDHGVTADMLDPAKRTFELKNNAYYWPQKLVDFYKAYNDTVTVSDSIDGPTGRLYLKRKLVMPRWMSDYTKWTIDSLFVWNHTQTDIANNIEVDPVFNNDIANHIDKVIGYVRKITTNKLDVPWFYDPNNSLYPPAWPLPENLAYTNIALQSAGSDGYAVGDLNWFPDQKAKWLTNVETISTGVPENYKLSQNYPNPFNPETKIEFSLPKEENIKVIVYNILGQKVKTLVNQDFKAGSYSVKWNGTDDSGRQVTTGIYLYSLETESFKTTKKMVLMK